MRKIFLIFLGGILMASCCKEYECQPQLLLLAITDVDTTNTDTLFIETYDKTSGFTQLLSVDTVLLKDSLQENYPNEVQMYGDTATISNFENYNNYHHFGVITQDKNWQLITKNNTYQITEIKIKKETGCCGGILSLDCKKDCVSPITSYKLNGVLTNINTEYSRQYLFLSN